MIKIDVQVVARDGNVVVKSIPVSGSTLSATYEKAEKVEDGVGINLNHAAYFTQLSKPYQAKPTPPPSRAEYAADYARTP